MCKRNSPHKNEASMGCGRESPQIKKKKDKKKTCTGLARENPHIKLKQTRDV